MCIRDSFCYAVIKFNILCGKASEHCAGLLNNSLSHLNACLLYTSGAHNCVKSHLCVIQMTVGYKNCLSVYSQGFGRRQHTAPIAIATHTCLHRKKAGSIFNAPAFFLGRKFPGEALNKRLFPEGRALHSC